MPGDRRRGTATATSRSSNWWSIDVPEVDGLFTQAKRLDQIAKMVADAGELLTDVPAAEFEVTLDYDFGDPAALREAEAVKERTAAAQRAVEEASQRSRAVVP